MRGFLLLPMLLLAGCGGDALYYQTRYIPTDSEATYSGVERISGGERDTYMLPSNPPALDDLHRARVCDRPGPRFKSDPMVSIDPGAPGSYDRHDEVGMGGYDNRPAAVSALGPMKGLPIHGWKEELVPGAKEPRGTPAMAGTEERPTSKTGMMGEGEVQPMDRYREDELWWCDPSGQRHLR